MDAFTNISSATSRDFPQTSPTAVAALKQRLSTLEATEEVSVLYACESGSRAWDIQSVDSDYDVRGIYAGSLPDYLSIGGRQDIIEQEFTLTPAIVSEVYPGGDERAADVVGTEIDLVLWDVKKFLSLLNGGNAAAREWLQSPIVYESSRWGRAMQDQEALFFDARSYSHHYISLAENNYDRYVRDEEEPLRKKYLYITRAIRQAQRIWEAGTYTGVCFDMAEITEGIGDDKARVQFRELVSTKRGGEELGRSRRMTPLDEWIERQLDGAREKCNEMPSGKDSTEHANRTFRKALNL
jgi:hypothetical protein